MAVAVLPAVPIGPDRAADPPSVGAKADTPALPRRTPERLQAQLDAREYGLDLNLNPWEGRCQIIRGKDPSGQLLDPPWACPGAGQHVIADYRGQPIRICTRHRQALQGPGIP
jgi:hypothetical protein